MSFKVIELDRVERNEGQPRSIFDEDKLAELAASIAEFGVRSPIEVRRPAGQLLRCGGGDRREA